MPSTTRARDLNERGRETVRKDPTRSANSEYSEKGVRNRLAVGWLSSGMHMEFQTDERAGNGPEQSGLPQNFDSVKTFMKMRVDPMK
jgi:hypothetical protein